MDKLKQKWQSLTKKNKIRLSVVTVIIVIVLISIIK
jgi:flagellar biosynthesis/type III secretory pathway M-ring protein FliF/YscJ